MKLFERDMVPCTLLEVKQAPDGRGGSVTGYTEKEKIMAAIVFNGSSSERAGDKTEAIGAYTIATKEPLKPAWVIRRDSDGKTFLTDSASKQTPPYASFSMHQIQAKEWAKID